MKNRKNIIVAFLLCACLIVGIGYAALTTDLFLNGKASIDKALAEDLFDTNIIWTKAESENTDKVSAEIINNNDTVSILANGLDTKNEQVTVTCVMTNNSVDTDALVTIPTYTIEGDAGNYISVTIDSVSGNTMQDGKIYLAKGQSATVTVTFELIKSFVPTDTLSTVASTFNLTYTAEALNNAG